MLLIPRSSHSPLTLILAMLVAVAPAAEPAAPTLAASRAKLPDLSIPAACGMQLKGSYATEKDMDQIKAMGATFVRRGFHWEGVEKEKGVYDFSGHDEVMKQLRDRGFRVLGVLAFNNKHYGHVREEPARSAYARYAAALAERYKADKVMWEIWNEPNTMTFWGKHGKKGNTDAYAEEYMNLVTATVPAIRAVDPEATIIGGSTSNLWEQSYNWCGFMFARGVLKTGIDAWSVHPYSKLPEEYYEAYATVRDLMEKHGGPRDFPMMNSERGFPINSKGEGFAGGDPQRQQEIQAWMLARQQLVDLALGMHGTLWYEWKNDKEGFGIFNGDTPNQAYKAYETLIAQLRGYRFSKRIEVAAKHDFVLAFTGPGDAVKLVAWTGPKDFKKLETTEAHAIELPVEATGTIAVVGLTGAASTLPVADGKITLALDGGPQYLTIRAGR